MTSSVERTLIRILVGGALGIALLSFALVPIPEDVGGEPALPAVALGQAGLYRLEVALLVFYGGLLLATPAFSGLTRGRLPIEISTRGAKFAEEADQSDEAAEAADLQLEESINRLVDRITSAEAKINRLQKDGDDR